MINHYNLLCLVIFCSFFSVKIFVVNLSYLLSIFLLLSFVFLLIKDKKISKNSLLFFFLALFIFVMQYCSLQITFERVGEYNFLSPILFVYCVILGGIAYHSASKLDLNIRIKAYKNSLLLLVVFLSLELCTRLLLKPSGGDFYDYKISYMYYDSNFTGLVILNYLFFYYYLRDRKNFYFPKCYEIVLWLFLLLTFSRASILVGFVFYIILYKVGRWRNLFVFLFLLVSIFVFYDLLTQYLQGNNFRAIDGSFNSKFYILKKSIEIFNELTLKEHLFGIGLGNFEYYTGIFAHNILVTFLIEFGLLSAGVLVLFFLLVIKRSNGFANFIIIVNLIAGFSLFSAYSPFLLVLSALILLEENKSSNQLGN